MSFAPSALPSHASLIASPSEVDSIVSRQQAHASTVREAPLSQRKAKLRRLRDALLAHRSEIHAALASDLQKPVVETDLTEIKTTIDEIQYAIDHLDDWATPTRVGTPFLYTGTRSEVRYEPKGVVLILAPWNYPLNLTLGPLASALAAGNCVVLKPSEYAPRTTVLLHELIDDLYDAREITVVPGGADVANACTHQPFDHIFFTGSPSIGRQVMRAAAEHLTSVTLELGGKSPAIVDRTANLRRAARRIVWSKFVNAGQTCIAPDYLLVEQGQHDALVDHLRDAIHDFYGASPRQQQASTDYARLAYDGHYESVVHLLTDALRAGAQVAVGGTHDPEDRFVAPTVLTDVPLDAEIMQEEIFGPLLPVRPFRTLDKALQVVNERAAPLSLYLFTEREATVETVLSRTTAGSTCINEGFLHYNHPELPFGGKGESGIGRGHGRRGFEAFSNERAVLRRSYGARVLEQLFPPYGRRTERLVEWILRLS
ncbi:MAG: aldehyde dehydrogenase family protein [Salinibacter sp.]